MRAYEAFRRIEYLMFFSEFVTQERWEGMQSQTAQPQGDSREDHRDDLRMGRGDDRRRDHRGGHPGVRSPRRHPGGPLPPCNLPADHAHPYHPRDLSRDLTDLRDPLRDPAPRRHRRRRETRRDEEEAERRHRQWRRQDELRRAQQESRHRYLYQYRRAVALAAEANQERDEALAAAAVQQTVPMRVEQQQAARPPRRKAKSSQRWRSSSATATATEMTPAATSTALPSVRPESFPLPGSPDSRIDPHNPPVISLDLSVETMDELVQEVRELATSV